MKVKILEACSEEKIWMNGRKGEIVMRHDPDYLGSPKIKILDDNKKEHYIWGIECFWERLDESKEKELTKEEEKGREILNKAASAIEEALTQAIEQMDDR